MRVSSVNTNRSSSKNVPAFQRKLRDVVMNNLREVEQAMRESGADQISRLPLENRKGFFGVIDKITGNTRPVTRQAS